MVVLQYAAYLTLAHIAHYTGLLILLTGNHKFQLIEAIYLHTSDAANSRESGGDRMDMRGRSAITGEVRR